MRSGFALSAISCFNHRLAAERESERGITAFRSVVRQSVRLSGAEAAADQTRWSYPFEVESYVFTPLTKVEQLANSLTRPTLVRINVLWLTRFSLFSFFSMIALHWIVAVMERAYLIF